MIARAIAMPTVRAFRDDASDAVVEEAAEILHNHGLIAMPTESFYALGASAFDGRAVQRVCQMKGRPAGKPLLVLIAGRSHLDGLVSEITPAASVLMTRFWPGPLTLIFSASNHVPDLLTAGTGTVGIRLPAFPILVQLLRYVGPLTGTSANRSGEPPAQTAQAVTAVFGDHVDLVLDGGPTAGGLPSTLVDATGPVRLLREGPIRRAAIETALAQQGITLK